MRTFTALFAAFDPDINVRGRQFERVCEWFLTNDPQYRTTLRRVWLWDEWPGRWTADAGIDLVAEDHDRKLWAVQAKAYDSQRAVTKADVNTFLSESSRAVISYRLLIASTDRLSPNARRTIAAQEKPVGFIGRADLLTAEVDWPVSPDALWPSPPPNRVKPRDYQRAAIRDVVTGFDGAGRGQLIMACGTGKTLTARFITDKLGAQRTLVLVPSLSLLKQTMRVWSGAAFDTLPVCSDETVARNEDAAVTHVSELGLPVTTDPAEIAAFLRKRSRPRVVFSTYQSSPRIVAAYALGRVPDFDLVICDEAHRCAGPITSEFATVLDADLIKAKRRLFMTATPRYYTGRVRKAAHDVDLEVASMDDEASFGTVFHRLGFSEAIRRDLLTDYQVVVVGVDDAEYRAYAEQGTLVTRDGKAVTDARSLAGQIGLAKAMRKHNLRRTISFHSRVNRAREFAAELTDVIAWMPARQRPKGALWSAYASGEMSAGERHVLLAHLAHLDDGERGLLANARCLAEGVDVPTLDGVAFIDPRRSEVDIVQAVGRAIRKADDKAVGTIVIPVFIDTDTDPEVALDDSVFKPVWDIVKALRAHDDDLAEQIDSMRRTMGRDRGVPRLPDKIHLDVPVTVSAAFAEAFEARLVEMTSAPWEFWFGLLQRYAEEHGDAGIRDDHVTDDGYRLGKWVGKQRTKWESLSGERRRQLQGLPGWTLDARASLWESSMAALIRYAEENGSATPPRGLLVDGIDLESWIRRQRRTWDQLTDERRQRLHALPGWTLNARDDKWDVAYQYLQKYLAEHGTAAVKQSYITEDGYRLGKWVSVQRRIWAELSGDRRQRLEQLPGWTLNARGDWWEDWFRRLQEYVAEHGNARVPQKHVTPDGAKLGAWVANQKSTHKQLSETRRERLEQLPGWTYDSHAAFWEDGFNLLRQYAEKRGTARPPSNCVVNGFKLGIWVNTQRQNWAALEEDKRQRLEALPGWVLNTQLAQWDVGYGHLLRYVEENGTALVPVYCVVDGFKLGQWVGVQRAGWKTMQPERKRLLAVLPGWSVSIRDAWWEEGFRQLQLYAEKNGYACPPQAYEGVDGFRLGSWVATQRGALLRGKMPAKRQRRLEALPGWEWAPRSGPRRR